MAHWLPSDNGKCKVRDCGMTVAPDERYCPKHQPKKVKKS